MHFPYGLSNFGTLRQEGYWYLDRTDRLAALENAGRQLIFLRPRRFGKSLLLSMLEHYTDARAASRAVAERLYLDADLTPLCALIEQSYCAVLSNRDYRWTNELLVKFAFLTLLFDDRLYMVVSELETERGYADLALIVRPDMRRFQALDLLLEFKYLSLKELGLSGEQVRQESLEALAKRPAEAAKLDEAEAQARDYGGTLTKRHGLTDLRAFAVVALGVERLVFRPVPGLTSIRMA